MATNRCWDPEELIQAKGSRVVIIDSNFLFVPHKFKVDIFEELKRLLGGNVRFFITRPIINELFLIKKDAKNKDKKEIDFALGLMERCEIIELNLRPNESVDDSIIRISSEGKFMVATNDIELRKRLRNVGVAVIYLRQKSHLELEGNA
jgi:rRNA-processing protein FCF1